MAIKSKTRSRGRRAAARSRKPVYVPVRTPILRRRGFWIGVLVVVVVGSAAGIAYGLAKEASNRRADELQARLATTMGTYQSKVDPVLAGVGTANPPVSFSALPDLHSAISGLNDGSVAPSDAATKARDSAEQAETAAKALGQIDVPTVVGGKGFTVEFVNYAINAKTRFVEALDLYQRVATLAETASTMQGQAKNSVLDSASGILATADKVMNDGYTDYIQAQTVAGTYVATLPNPPTTGATGGGKS